MNRATFFNLLRPALGGHLTQAQVDGITALLDALDKEGVTDLRQQAYVLATPMIETGGSYEPITESLNYSAANLIAKFPNRITQAQAVQYGRTSDHPADQKSIGNIIYGGKWGASNLGNTEPGDGYLYRGRGLVQTTGRRLYTIFGFATNPELVCDVATSADIMVKGMRDGTFTGKKLSDYLGTDWVGARRIVNGQDRAQDIAAWAMKIYNSLKASI